MVESRKQHATSHVVRNSAQSSWPAARGVATRACCQAQLLTPQKAYHHIQEVEFHPVWSGMEDSIAKSKQFLSNKFTSGLVGAKSVWQNVLTCQLALQFLYIMLCITMVRILSPLDFPFSKVWMLKTEQWWDQVSVLLNYLKLQGFVFLNGRIGCFILEMGIVLRYRQTGWIRCHLPHSATSGFHCCKFLKMVSSSEIQLGKNKISAIFSSFPQEMHSVLRHAKKFWFNPSISEEQCSVKTNCLLQVLVRLSLFLQDSKA